MNMQTKRIESHRSVYWHQILNYMQSEFTQIAVSNMWSLHPAAKTTLIAAPMDTINTTA